MSEVVTLEQYYLYKLNQLSDLYEVLESDNVKLREELKKLVEKHGI